MDNFVHNAANKTSEFLQYVVVRKSSKSERKRNLKRRSTVVVGSTLGEDIWTIEPTSRHKRNSHREDEIWVTVS
jgi:hypothetical protein